MTRLLLALVVLIAGCQTAPPRPRLVAPPEATALSFAFVDARSQLRLVTTQEQDSLGTTVFFGDDAFTRPPSVLVGSWLQDRAGTALAGKRVELKELKVQVFQPAAGNSSLASGPAPLPMAVDAAGSGKSAVVGSLLAPVVIDYIARRSRSSLVSARIEATVDGVPVVGLSRQSLTGHIAGDDIHQVLFEALDDLSRDAGRL
ncbi:hypothetical protein [Rubrivivax benzoatilyticus]|uniref:ABC-type transport auxiliary lipoprotein component domain-containing protein n=1 Tax=Rubrivivax benzoatilyticus TaxID=316997 RepID=A0ABX0HQH4_9BURK|nr:hypothetical protein [Rubrivivax benzoatilyticus]EGJ11846.1 hypothetical protein RBXJA2T_16027 [Rubrivivax benzoatilyticus JA2 = ATCC BAA-35]NHK96873.1 hypothetical protein [Rubrivivax benzoatilyticus]NHL24588.1 hypothetical protein [Rubrivivax benzoatilyticus]